MGGTVLRDLFSLFPAYAGVILVCAYLRDLTKTFPRIRGGDPFAQTELYMGGAFSPHTRG